MNKSAARGESVVELYLKLFTSFALIKLISLVVQTEFSRHYAVAGLLLVIPLIGSRQALSFLTDLTLTPRNLWGTFFCLLYVVVPASVLFLAFPEEWFRARIELQSWISSTDGFAAVFIAPLSEEYFFRGWLLKFQMRRLGHPDHDSVKSNLRSSWFWICYLNALVFWLFHLPVQSGMLGVWRESLSNGLIPLSPGPFFLGMIASALTLLTGTPRAAVVFHMLANASGPLWWPLLRSEGVRSLFYF